MAAVDEGRWSRQLEEQQKLDGRTPLVQLPSDAFVELSMKRGVSGMRPGCDWIEELCLDEPLQLPSTEYLNFKI